MSLPFAALNPYTVVVLEVEYQAPVCDCVSDTSDTSDAGGETIII